MLAGTIGNEVCVFTKVYFPVMLGSPCEEFQRLLLVLYEGGLVATVHFQEVIDDCLNIQMSLCGKLL